MTYIDFYNITKQLAAMSRDEYSERECIKMAHDYLIEYNYSILRGKPTRVMKSLCEIIVLDMDANDYIDDDNTLDINAMKRVLSDFAREMEEVT